MSRWVRDWRPEDPEFWAAVGARTARRNLVFSIFAEHLGFSVWLLWSAVAVSLPKAGFDFSVDQRFWLVALPNLVGAVARLPYTAAVARFGGRTWTTVSAAALVLPLVLLAVCVSDPRTPYWMFLVAAATAGLGGGNFASSMANISHFYPERSKGAVLGLNAAGGNIGVAVVQLVVPIVVTLTIFGAPPAHGVALQNVAWVWLPLVVLATGCAWLFMDNVAVVRATLRSQLVVLRNPHTWVMSVLYIGTFGSFIGYSAALPLLATSQFPGSPGARLAFLGPLVGSLARPLGGWLADRYGGAKVTGWVFVAMAVGVLGVLLSLQGGGFGFFLGSFLLLFVTSGVGNGSTFRMIPAIWTAGAADGADPEALPIARRQAAAVIGLSSAVGALGGFFVPRSFGVSVAATGSADAALVGFLAFYAVCLATTWWWYLRRSFATAAFPSLAWAKV
jgi:NNP family nitrate/nitrite transporter-like MFS transporter